MNIKLILTVWIIYFMLMPHSVISFEKEDINLPQSSATVSNTVNNIGDFIPDATGTVSGIITKTSGGIQVANANAYQAPAGKGSLHGATDTTLKKDGSIQKVASAGEIKTPQVSAIGIENANLETGDIETAVQLTDSSGITLENSNQVHITDSPKEPNTNRVLTAQQTDLNIPSKITGSGLNNFYYNSQSIAFDSANEVLLRDTVVPLRNVGQTRIDFIKPVSNIQNAKIRRVQTVLKDGILTMPNPLSNKVYFKTRELYTYIPKIQIPKTLPDGTKTYEEKIFQTLSEAVQYLSLNNKVVGLDGKNNIVTQLKSMQSNFDQNRDKFPFTITEDGAYNCPDCVMHFNEKTNK